MSDTFQERILDKLDEHSSLLSTIASEIAGLKRSDQTLERDHGDVMEQLKSLENRVRDLELKLAFASVLGTLIALIGGGLAYFLK